MKKLILFLTTLLVLQTAFAAGGISSNGGDGTVSEFFDIARALYRMMVRQNLSTIDIPLFANTINGAKIYSQERVFLEGNEVTAINTPKLQEIRISLIRWKNLNDNPKQKYVLVLHEFLGLMGYDDRTFSISNEVLNGPGIIIDKVSCPFLTGSSLENASSYTLETIRYKVNNYYDYRTSVYLKGQPDENSETIAADRMRMKKLADGFDFEIGTVGSSLIMKDNPLSGGTIIHFEFWPGIPYSGTSYIQNDDPPEKVQFFCTGSFL